MAEGIKRDIPLYTKDKFSIPYIRHASRDAEPEDWNTIKFPNSDKYPDLDAAKSHALRCWACRSCEISTFANWAYICPPAAFPKNSRTAAYRGHGKNYLVLGLLQGYFEPTEAVAEAVFQCALCGNCTIQCAIGGGASDPLVSLDALRRTFVKLGLGPMPKHKRFIEFIQKYHNAYGEPTENRFAWWPPEVKKPVKKKKADVLYFAGCTGPYRVQEPCIATVKLLNAAGVDFTVLDTDEWCCGSPALMVGAWEEARETLKHDFELIEELGVSRVVTTCAGCYRQLKEGCKKLGLKPPVEIIYTVELVNELIRQGKLKPTKPLNITITYHDPCHTGRHIGLFDEPRELISYLPGVKFVEMERIFHQSWCCGAGGGMMSGFPETAKFAATERLKEAKATGASYLTTVCPFCELNFYRAEQDAKTGIVTGGEADLIVLLAKACGLM